jgi:hypothetical protein
MAGRSFFFPVAVPLLFVAASVFTVPTSGAGTAAGVLVKVLMGVLMLYLVLGLFLQLAGFDGGGASEIAKALSVDADQQRLLHRWLERARWARFVGGLSGILVFLFSSKNGGNDPFLCAFGGIAVGAMVAEMHHLRSRGGPRTARLEVRSVDHYRTRQDRRLMSLVGLVGLAVMVTGIVGALTRHVARPAVWWGLLAIVVLVLAHLAQCRVASRARSAVSEKLTRADDLVRTLAISRGLARPATFFALALVAAGCRGLVPLIGTGGSVLSVIAWLYAIALWWKNRRLGLDFLLTEPSEPVLS